MLRREVTTWVAGAAMIALYALRGLLRQDVQTEARRKLTMTIAEVAVGRQTAQPFLVGDEAEAAVFKGRYAAEQIVVRHLPALFAEPIAALFLLGVVPP